MALLAKDTGGSGFDPVEAGVHQAICIWIYDLGTQYNERFENSSRKVVITWELPKQRIEIDGEDLPRVISSTYTLSLHEKANLRQMLEGWRGKAFTGQELLGFDLFQLLGINCQIQVIHKESNGKTYANVKAVFPLQKSDWMEPTTPMRKFSFDDDKPLPDETPDWIFNIIKESEEWELFNVGANGIPSNDYPPHKDDDIPF